MPFIYQKKQEQLEQLVKEYQAYKVKVNLKEQKLNGDESSTRVSQNEIRSWFNWYKNDSTVRSGINTLAESSVGFGYHTIMPSGFKIKLDKDGEEITPEQKELVDEFGRILNLDHLMPNITRLMLIAGFCPVETRVTKYPTKSKLKIIHPKTVQEIYVDKYGDFDYLVQQTDQFGKGKKFTKDEVTLFTYNQIGNDLTGMSLVETVEPLLSIKHAALNNMEGMIERYISPLYIWLTTGDITPVKNALTGRSSGEDIFLGNLDLNEFEQFKAQPIEVKGDSKFSEFINFVDQLIWIGINSPNQMYWRNATEASATVLNNIAERNYGSIQRNVGRGMEQGFFKRLLEKNDFNPDEDNDCPRVIWGMEKTGVEEVRIEDFLRLGIEMFYVNEDDWWDMLINQFGIKVKPHKRDGDDEVPDVEPKKDDGDDDLGDSPSSQNTDGGETPTGVS